MFRGALRVITSLCRLTAVVILIALIATSSVAASGEPAVIGEYAVVINADTGAILLDKSMDTPTAPASLTKLFTTAYALDAAPLDKKLTVDQADLVGESSMGLQSGETITLKTALYGMLLPSGNDAAMTVAQNLGAETGDTPQQSVDRFVGWVNDMATRLGLSNTHLVNPHGLDQSGHVTSARDVAAITMYALKNPEFRQIIATPYYNGDGHDLYQANKLLGEYPGLIGGKTGITDNAGYCLVEVAHRDGQTVIAVVMKSTDAAWYQDASSLLDYGFNAITAGQTAPNTSPITLSPVVVQPGVQGSTISAQATTAAPLAASASKLSVHQVSDNVAVVSHNILGTGASGFTWKWPLASLLAMLAMLAIVVNYPIVIGAGSLLWRYGVPTSRAVTLRMIPQRDHSSSRPRRSRQARRSRNGRSSRESSVAAAPPTASHESRWGGVAQVSEPAEWENVVSLNAAETIGTRAVRLAQRGDYHAASSEFSRALRTDSTFDLSRCAGFWGMQPAGYVAAARAYALTDRTSDAKSLLTVIKLGCGSHRELESLLQQVVTPGSH